VGAGQPGVAATEIQTNFRRDCKGYPKLVTAPKQQKPQQKGVVDIRRGVLPRSREVTWGTRSNPDRILRIVSAGSTSDSHSESAPQRISLLVFARCVLAALWSVEVTQTDPFVANRDPVDHQGAAYV
jgi:hypothetical protein